MSTNLVDKCRCILQTTKKNKNKNKLYTLIFSDIEQAGCQSSTCALVAGYIKI